ncbi:hypothetical protein LVD15_22875 [Fulvivirga maritima]|uniref:hypothetical protein n=1 Tax=Fulvivirga maritima TaxID=2904247 RepID=UPI001F2861F8|nr:hypothetical protein [Fulvivirga maritima]UII26118.1 hypothetical protein LVD15_22875 [Fulvivirga maritima]
MANCYQCGNSGANYRRTVNTGYSVGGWYGRRSGGASSRAYYGLRTVCEECAAHEDLKSVKRRVRLYFIIAFIQLFFLLR